MVAISLFQSKQKLWVFGHYFTYAPVKKAPKMGLLGNSRISSFCLFFLLLDLTLLLPNGRRNGYYLLLLLLLVNPSDGSLDWRFLLNYIIKPIGWEPLYLTAQALCQGLYYNIRSLLQVVPLGTTFQKGLLIASINQQADWLFDLT